MDNYNPNGVPVWKQPNQHLSRFHGVPQQQNVDPATIQGTTAIPLPPAPSGPMSWWGKVLQISSDIHTLVQLFREDPVYYPWIDFPPDAESFDQTNVIPCPVVVGLETLVLEYDVAKGWDGSVLGLAHAYLGPQDSLNYAIPSLTWRIYIDKRPVNGYSAIKTQFGSTGFPRPISPILVNSGQRLRYTVTNNDVGLPAAGNFIYANFAGRVWPHRQG